MNSKWLHLGLGLATVVVGYLATVNWTDLLPSYGGALVMAIGLIKTLLPTFDKS